MNAQQRKLPPLTFIHRPCKGYELQDEDGTHIIQSPVFETPEEFYSAVLSVNYIPGEQGWLMTELQVRQSGVWSKFFQLALYSCKANHSYDAQEDESAKLAVDELQCKRPAQAYRFRLTMKGGGDIPEIIVCVSAAGEKQTVRTETPVGQRVIEVRPVSQMLLPVSDIERVRLCSPTSLSMALDALGVPNDPLETAAAVYDAHACIYGNWTLNTAYACRRGFSACVTRFERLEQLEEFLTPQSLVLATIAYKSGELSGAAVSHTPGHLVLLCGWAGGRLRVADPAAAQTQDVIRFYDAAQFARAWLGNKRGAAYLVRKL